MPSFWVISSIGPAFNIGSFWVVILNPLVLKLFGLGAVERGKVALTGAAVGEAMMKWLCFSLRKDLETCFRLP